MHELSEELCCPLCGYDLRGIGEPRCPECGYSFTWEELRDPTRRLHPYLFEHHPNRPVWSFVRTVVGGLLPGRFWRRLYPTQPSYPRRLVLYWFIVVAVAFVPFAIAYTSVVIVQKSEVPKWRSSASTFNNEEMLDRYFPLFPSPRFFLNAINHTGMASTWLLVAIVWPWMSVASMLLLRTSMRRARIKVGHVVRCSVYAGDAMLWVSLVLLLPAVRMLMAALELNVDAFYHASLWYRHGLVPLALLLALMAWRLFVAYRKYLRLPHAWAVALLLQVAVWLAIIIVLGGFDDLLRRGWVWF